MTRSVGLWAPRIGMAFAVWAVLVVGGSVFGNQPRAGLLALGVAAVACVSWLYLDVAAAREPAEWDRPAPAPVRLPGEDPRLALFTRMIGQHLDAREVSGTLRRHLLDLADHRLVATHGVAWRADPELAEPLLGPELAELAHQQAPYPRMSLDQIDRLIARIEAL
jgi:hypothetical protein